MNDIDPRDLALAQLRGERDEAAAAAQRYFEAGKGLAARVKHLEAELEGANRFVAALVGKLHGKATIRHADVAPGASLWLEFDRREDRTVLRSYAGALATEKRTAYLEAERQAAPTPPSAPTPRVESAPGLDVPEVRTGLRERIVMGRKGGEHG